MTSSTPYSGEPSTSDLASLFGAEPTPPLSSSDPPSCPAPRNIQPTNFRARCIPRPRPPIQEKNPELTSLRDQLELLLAENIITERVRQARSAIIQRIRILEAEEAKRVEDEKKVKLCKEGLPEPVARGEKKKLMDSAKKVAKAKVSGERSQVRKRKKKVIDEDDMDGEEKLRLGLEVKNKKRKSKVSGKWFSDIYGV